MLLWIVVAAVVTALLALGWRHDRKRRGRLSSPSEHRKSQSHLSGEDTKLYGGR